MNYFKSQKKIQLRNFLEQQRQKAIERNTDKQKEEHIYAICQAHFNSA